MSFSEVLKIVITGDAAGAQAAFKSTAAAAERDLGRTEKAGAKVAGQMTKVGLGMMAAGGVMVAAMFKAGSAAEDYALSVGKIQRVAGGTAQTASTLAYSLQRAGVDTDAGAKAFGALAKAMDAGKLKEYGIASRDANGEMREMPAVLNDIADKMASTTNAAERDAMAKTLLGRAGMDLLPVLMKGSQGFADAAAEAKKFGLVLDQDAIAKARELKSAQRDLEAATKGLTVSIGQQAMPMMASYARVGTNIVSAIAKANDATGGFIGTMGAMGGSVLVAVGAGMSLVGVLTKVGTNLKNASVGQAFGASIAAGLAIGIAYAADLEGKLAKIRSDMEDSTKGDLNAAQAKGYDQLTAAIRDNIAQVDQAKQAADEYWNDGMNKINPLAAKQSKAFDEQALAQQGVTQGYIDIANAASDLAAKEGISRDEALKRVVAQKDAAEQTKLTGKATEDLGKTDKDAAIDAKNLNDAFKDQADKVKDLRDRFKELLGIGRSDVERQGNYDQALRDVNKSIGENGSQLNYMTGQVDLTSEAGRKNFQVLNDLAGQIDEWSTKVRDEKGTEAGKRKFDELTASLRTQLLPQLGNNYVAVDKLMGRLGLNQQSWEYAVKVTGVDKAEEDLFKLGIGRMGFGGGGHAAPDRSTAIGAISGYASGTQSATPGWHLFGEKGPELGYVPGGTSVNTADETAAMLSAGGGNGPIVINLTITDENGAVRTRQQVTHERSRGGVR